MTNGEKLGMFISVLTVSGGVLIGLWRISSEYQVQLGRVERLEDQVRTLEARVNVNASDVAALKDQLRIFEGRVDNAASGVAQLSRRSNAVVNPIQQKCLELAEQANRYSGELAQRAIMLMKELGCNSTAR